MVARWIEELGQFFLTSSIEQAKKIAYADNLSLINTEDDEQTAFVNAIAKAADQDNTDYGSRVWHLDKSQRVTLRDSQQSDKVLKDGYS